MCCTLMNVHLCRPEAVCKILIDTEKQTFICVHKLQKKWRIFKKNRISSLFLMSAKNVTFNIIFELAGKTSREMWHLTFFIDFKTENFSPSFTVKNMTVL
jgi:hypothetical protein